MFGVGFWFWFSSGSIFDARNSQFRQVLALIQHGRPLCFPFPVPTVSPPSRTPIQIVPCSHATHMCVDSLQGWRCAPVWLARHQGGLLCLILCMIAFISRVTHKKAPPPTPTTLPPSSVCVCVCVPSLSLSLSLSLLSLSLSLSASPPLSVCLLSPPPPPPSFALSPLPVLDAFEKYL